MKKQQRGGKGKDSKEADKPVVEPPERLVNAAKDLLGATATLLQSASTSKSEAEEKRLAKARAKRKKQKEKKKAKKAAEKEESGRVEEEKKKEGGEEEEEAVLTDVISVPMQHAVAARLGITVAEQVKRGEESEEELALVVAGVDVVAYGRRVAAPLAGLAFALDVYADNSQLLERLLRELGKDRQLLVAKELLPPSHNLSLAPSQYVALAPANQK